MLPANLPLVTRNLSQVAWNRVTKLYRQLRQRLRRTRKSIRESRKSGTTRLRGAMAGGRDAGVKAYSGSVKTARYWNHLGERTIPRIGRELSVRASLRRSIRGSEPIIIGPWLSEVGYEVLYWVPFVRWYADHYRIPPSRLVVVSRGGTAGWYAGLADRYVELLDLFTPAEFTARNADRQASGDQKQHGIASFDAEILDRVRTLPGLGGASLCHPSLMFRLLRQFWLGNESLQFALDYLRYRRMSPPPVVIPDLPAAFVTVKFYNGMALPDTPTTRHALRTLVTRVAARSPVVLLSAGLTLDEHEDYVFRDVPGVTAVAASLTPQNNLAIQTELIRRSSRFIGTCGSLAWLAPMLGTDTLAVYADDHLLTSHLYAARHAFDAMGAARFTPLDIAALEIPPI